ncbi:hypothetical protein Y695_03557 [Hydrogenophaga sp. T4]|nr:hypothetical protein Y695_03557 [Hydrogenophaga sp. T4]
MSLFSPVWICMLTSGDMNSLSPLTGEAKCTPSSVILRMAPSDQTWNPPESVRMGLFHFSKPCRPPKLAMTSRPGRIQRWKVLPRMIWRPCLRGWRA